jgi:hypothetical protein
MSDLNHMKCEVVRANWKGPFSPKLWRELSLAAGSSGSSSEADRLTIGPGLPSKNDARVAVLTARKAAKLINYGFVVDRPPDAEPPKSVTQADRRCGGHEGLRALLAKTAGRGAAPIATYSVHLHLKHSRWSCFAIPRPADDADVAVRNLSRAANVERIGYRLDGGANGLEEIDITFYHLEDEFRVDMRARGVLRPGESKFLPYADDVRDLVVANFFKERSL